MDKKILIIDYEKGFVETVKNHLEANDYEIITAFDGVHAKKN